MAGSACCQHDHACRCRASTTNGAASRECSRADSDSRPTLAHTGTTDGNAGAAANWYSDCRLKFHADVGPGSGRYSFCDRNYRAAKRDFNPSNIDAPAADGNGKTTNTSDSFGRTGSSNFHIDTANANSRATITHAGRNRSTHRAGLPPESAL